MRLSAKLWQLPLLIGLSACSSLSGEIPGNTSIVPKGSLHIFPKYAVTHADIVQVGLLLAAVYMVTDPTAPNWEIVETRLPDNRVLYKLSMQYLHVGGDGEARYVLARRAEAHPHQQRRSSQGAPDRAQQALVARPAGGVAGRAAGGQGVAAAVDAAAAEISRVAA